MPYEIEKRDGKFCVVKQTSGKSLGCHATEEQAKAQMRAVYASETKKSVDEGEPFEIRTEFLKADQQTGLSLGLVFGWAIICKEDGKDYYDLQGDNIPEDAMLEAATDFMLKSRVVKEGHAGGERGRAVFAWPMTSETAKAYGVVTRRTGLMIAIKADEQMLKDVRAGKLSGFSIGGVRLEDEEVPA